jgi:Na+/phosphate symporter
MEAELEAYEYQLSQVKLTLLDDPTNQQLIVLASELEEIIDLTKQAIGPAVSGTSGGEAATTTGKGKNKVKGFKAGEEVSARYKDMKW